MGKRQRGGNKFGLEPWQSVIPADEVGYIRVGYSLLEHPAFQQLNSSAQMVYICMLKKSKKERTFSYPKADYQRDGFDDNTAQRAITSLISARFIEKSCSWTPGQPCLYTFTTGWKDG